VYSEEGIGEYFVGVIKYYASNVTSSVIGGNGDTDRAESNGLRSYPLSVSRVSHPTSRPERGLTLVDLESQVVGQVTPVNYGSVSGGTVLLPTWSGKGPEC
jgi:hypothetical protein